MKRKIQGIVKKGQSALEYVFSYGWSLVMVVAIMAAVVFLLPDVFQGEACTTNSYLAVSGIKSSDTGLEVAFINQTGINLQNVSLSTTGTVAAVQDLGTIRAGEKTKITVDAVIPETYTVEFVFTYYDSYNFEKKATINCQGKRSSSQSEEVGQEQEEGGEEGGGPPSLPQPSW